MPKPYYLLLMFIYTAARAICGSPSPQDSGWRVRLAQPLQRNVKLGNVTGKIESWMLCPKSSRVPMGFIMFYHTLSLAQAQICFIGVPGCPRGLPELYRGVVSRTGASFGGRFCLNPACEFVVVLVPNGIAHENYRLHS